jgi:chromosome segregation ATPase
MTTDKKTIKFVKAAEKLLDKNPSDRGVLLANADTQRIFGLLLPIDLWDEIAHTSNDTADALAEALETIDVLEDDNALLRLANLSDEELAEEFHKSFQYPRDPEPTELKEDGAVTVTRDEYEELVSLRKKREANHKQLSLLDAKLKEYVKKIQSLESSRDKFKARVYDLKEELTETIRQRDIYMERADTYLVCYEDVVIPDADGITRSYL